jgi:hypothetical protein
MANKKIFNNHLHCVICVSGAAETGHCVFDALEKAQAMGREIAKRNFILVTGATTGIPYWAAKGAKEAGGTVIGFSPAVSKNSHQRTYHLPIDYHDVIIYTGFGYSGRNLLLTRASDAVIIICGRIGTLNEFTIAFEDSKPIGVLEGTGGTADMLEDLVAKSHRGPGKIAYASKPAELLNKIVELIKQEEV